ncbi:MAG: DUF2806 domain-containing protein [Xanthobacteraceae bacterium]
MSDNSEKPGTGLVKSISGLIDKLNEGGLPQVLLGPAGKSISRLIGAGTDIPAAWFEQKAQSIRDETEARSKVMQMLAEKSAELGMSDPALLERGLNNLLGRAYREQQNKDAIALLTVQRLEDEPAPADSAGPSDDWLNAFEEKAAKASSDELRSLFSRILAGEIRKPGSFSLAALHVLSILDQRTASIIEEIVPFAFGNLLFRKALPEGYPVANLIELENIGIIAGSGGTLSTNWTTDSEGNFQFAAGGRILRLVYEPNRKIKIPVYYVSKSGSELFQVLNVDQDEQAIIKALWLSEPKKMYKIQQLPDEPGMGLLFPIEKPA